MSVAEFIESATCRIPHSAAVIIDQNEISYDVLWRRSKAFARALQDDGLASSERVATLLPNCEEGIETLVGMSLSSGYFVPLNYRYGRHELTQVLSDCRPAYVVVDDDPTLTPNRLELLRSVVGAWLPDGTTEPGSHARRQYGIRRIIRVVREADIDPDGFAAFLHSASPDTELRTPAAANRTLSIMYTSGTSSVPKGVVLPEAAFSLRQSAIAERMGVRQSDMFYSPLPHFHIAGFIAFLASASAGATYVSDRFFDAKTACKTIDKYKCRVMWSGFDTILRSILEAAEEGAGSLESLEVDACIGPSSSLQNLEGRLPHCRLLLIYGATELGSALCLPSPEDELSLRTESSGSVLAGGELLVADSAGSSVPIGQLGEICSRGPAVALGYYRGSGDVDRARFDDDGWFHSGDIGRRTGQDSVQYVSRLSDLIKIGGENVAPAEIESFLIRHPKVYEVQVVGVPDETYGEVPVAIVQWAPGTPGTEHELRSFCEGQLSRVRIPKEFWFLEDGDWPRSATKIQKITLRERAMAHRAGTPSTHGGATRT